MKLRWFGRCVEVNKNRIDICDFKKKNMLISISFNRKQMSLKDWKAFFLYLIMPYNWLEKYMILITGFKNIV